MTTCYEVLLGQYNTLWNLKGVCNLKTTGARGILSVPPPYKNKNWNSSKQRHVADQNDSIKMLITNLKSSNKTADLVKTGYFGRLFQDHFRLNQYFSKRFSDSCSAFQYSYFDMQHAQVLRNLNFSLIRGVGLFHTLVY